MSDEASRVDRFVVQVTDDEIADLRSRLAATRWPDQLAGTAWQYGTDREYLRDLCDYWRTGFDFGAFVGRCNAFPQHLSEIDGQRVHVIHARSPEPDARPLLLTHGWPGSVAEFFEVVGPLSDPVAHGGSRADAFHVVVPSLPGYGFSGPTSEVGWDPSRIARAFAELMHRLGYERFFAQGGDWGSPVSMSLAGQFPERVAAVHVNLLFAARPADDDPATLTESERIGVDAMAQFKVWETGYQAIQSTKPQTLAYGLTDSPAGLAGWIAEKFRTWSDCGGDIERTFTRDRLLDNISIYWFTATINSSMRLYYETNSPGKRFKMPPVTVPVGHAAYPAEIHRTPRRWADARYDIVHWSEMPRGGHFAAMEVPDLFVDDVRECFRTLPLR